VKVLFYIPMNSSKYESVIPLPFFPAADFPGAAAAARL